MAKLNITEAAKAVKKSRTTLHKHIKEGKISVTLDKKKFPLIDTSELIRYYGDICSVNSSNEQSTGLKLTVKKIPEHVQFLEHEMEILKLKLSHLDALKNQAEEETRHWRSQAERLSMLLTDQRQKTSPSQTEKTEISDFKPEQRQIETNQKRSFLKRVLAVVLDN